MSLSVESPTQSKIREAQFQFGRLMREINHKISAGDEFKNILNFLFDSLDTIIPYDRIGIALVEDGQLCAKWMNSKLPGGNLGPGYCGPLAGSSLKHILETGQPRIINDLVQYGMQKPDSESTKLALKDGIKSSLSLYLLQQSGDFFYRFLCSFDFNFIKAPVRHLLLLCS